MKKQILFALLIGSLLSCSQSKKELYNLTDSFVESLQTDYDSYGILDAKDHSKLTNDGLYQVMPLGRLINVKILNPVDEEAYKELQEDLKHHYKNDKRVNDVYMNTVGTIMIDCRN
ncbi:hypothetical protein [Daejeonella sp.]|uniref:hypothetical protein n=1 Tax=Daejeonella sp. TaxID=2805397 RepID=UPI0025B9359B|nr:hypothetical protein [Daejeonella sp.]